MIKDILEKVIAKQHLSFEESFKAMNSIMNGEVNNSQLAGLLIGLKSKGKSAEEIAGFASAMRENSIKIKTNNVLTIDVCGTGGDNSGTFNISTAVAFVVAGVGVSVAKHGNRSISSLCGSADVLQELGININLSPEQSEKALHQIGITFLFAPNFHPAMKHAAPVRKELGMKTIFNMLGPLTNPAGVKHQLIGTFNNQAAELMCSAAEYLGFEKVCFVCTDNRFDEILLNGETNVYEYDKTNGTKNYKITNETFSYPKVTLEEIAGADAKTNADIILNVLRDKKSNGAFYTVCANAAMALYAANFSSDLEVCKLAAEESILSGTAYDKLVALKDFV
ncbi:MAG: anthranilate phosphoribosyltransferase [Ignavibacteria bacterium]|nr:anthranilate phosphoribosyltransferase [Ignavibacteria bacterium]